MNGNIATNIETLEYIKKYRYEDNDKNLKLTSIIIVTYNQFKYTKLCIESIRKFTLKDFYEIIVVDNNSQDETVNWLRSQRDLKVIYNDENKGFPKACNEGIKIAKGDNILLLNNDVIVTPYWLNNLQKALYSSDDIGGTGCISNNCTNYQGIKVDYENIKDMIDFSFKINISNDNLWNCKTKLIGFCFMIKKEVIDKVGFLDERFTPGNFEDDDISLRIIKEGYKLILCKDVFIHHFGSSSFKDIGDEYIKIYINNLKKFKEKWGFEFEYNGYYNNEIIEFMDLNENDKLNILEVQCNIGSNLLEIKNRCKDVRLYGIDKSSNACDVAKNICTIINDDIETAVLPYDEKFFNYIILENTLQKFIDPLSLLKKLKKYLKPNGYILMTVPNIMHIRILKSIINGRFLYSDGGTLCKDNLRFFTLEEISNMANKSGFEIDEVQGISIGLTHDEEKFIDSLCLISEEYLRQQYGIYQYVLRIRES